MMKLPLYAEMIAGNIFCKLGSEIGKLEHNNMAHSDTQH
jgi:hypothetical protein